MTGGVPPGLSLFRSLAHRLPASHKSTKHEIAEDSRPRLQTRSRRPLGPRLRGSWDRSADVRLIVSEQRTHGHFSRCGRKDIVTLSNMSYQSPKSYSKFLIIRNWGLRSGSVRTGMPNPRILEQDTIVLMYRTAGDLHCRVAAPGGARGRLHLRDDAEPSFLVRRSGSKRRQTPLSRRPADKRGIAPCRARSAVTTARSCPTGRS